MSYTYTPNIREYCLNKIFDEIHPEILEKAFRKNPHFGFADNRSLEDIIEDEVLNKKVMPDANLIGGQQVLIRVDFRLARIVPFGLVLEIPCLLYTSPSPRDQRGSRMPSSA